MKNKIFFIFIIICQLFFSTLLNSTENLKIESSKFEIKDKGKIIESSGGVTVEYLDQVIITGNNSIYNKNKNEIEIFGKVKVIDRIKNIIILAEKLKYDEKNDILTSPEFTEILVNEKYNIKGMNLIYDRKSFTFKSDQKVILKDKKGNNFESLKFHYNIENELINSKKLKIIDDEGNRMVLDKGLVNLKTNEIIGKEINIDLNNSIFGNTNNDPRFKGRSVISNNKETLIYKGVFTPCGKTNKCPPWSIKAEEIKHKKKEKSIEYKNAWLEIYDKPVIYFPIFFHPDPTVKRKSGFLAPLINNSTNLGQSFQIPYYKVISDRRDLTVTPRIFIDNNILMQGEYRQANKKSDFTSDFSINKFIENNSEGHVFANLKGNKNNLEYEINLESVNNDSYLKSSKIKSPLIDDPSLLNSYIDLEINNQDYYFNSKVELYEDLTKKDSDRYEFIYPTYSFNKTINLKSESELPIEFSSTGYQKKYQTNVYESLIVNDFKYNTRQKIFNNGVINNFEFLLRNVNTNSERSKNYKENTNNELLSSLLFKSSYPMIKESKKDKKLFSPIFSARYSPNKTKNISDEDRLLNFENIFLMDRLGKNDLVEGGQSFTVGLEYESINKITNKSNYNLGIAQIYTDNENLDLPKKTTMNNKSSDIVGYINLKPTDNFDVNYNFSVDNSLGHTNYDFIKANLSINNIVTSFEFLEEDNIIGNQSYASNKTTIGLNQKNYITFETRKNLDTNITEFYNLIYEYKNNCLTASIEYNKDYYKDANIEPEENIFFKIKLVPLGEISGPSFN